MLILAVSLTAYGADRYASPWGDSTPPYGTWESAATNLSDAVGAALPGETVWVTNGVYQTGGAAGLGLASRLALTNEVAVRSVNGYRFTVIEGAPHDAGAPLGAAAVRAAYMTAGELDGFTLRKGFTSDSGVPGENEGGGMYAAGGTQSNCRVAGNYGQTAGGAYLTTCLVSNGLFEMNNSESGPHVRVAEQVKLHHCRINNTDSQFPSIRILGMDGTLITNASIYSSTSSGTDFGMVDVSSGESTHTFTITNEGARTLYLTGWSTNGGQSTDFAITPPLATQLVASASTTFQVTFRPGEVGTRRTMVFLSNNDPDDDPYVLWLAGEGVEPLMLVLATNYSVITNGSFTPLIGLHTDFGEVDVTAGTVTNSYCITNAGSATLNISDVALVGWDAADFTVVDYPSASVATGETAWFSIAFDPSVTGVRTTLVEIASDTPGSPYTYLILGTGVEPEIQVLGTNLDLIPNGDLSPQLADGTDFGICSADPLSHIFTITNAGRGELELTGTPYVVITGAHTNDFRVTAQPTTPVAGGGVTTFTVEFFPLVTSVRTAEVQIVNNDTYHTNELYSFRIIGSGSSSNPFVNVNAGLHDLGAAALAWGDYDNDGQLDLALSGYDGTNRFTDIYRNNAGTFTNINAGFIPVESGRLAWGDYDNDGWLDIVICGFAGTQTVTEIYRNDHGVFSNIHAGLIGVYNGGLAWGDSDNDGDLDLVVAGYTRSNSVSRIYRNDEGVFTDIAANLLPVRDARATWVDFDQDGWLDLMLAGDDGHAPSARLYKNYGGSFTNYNPATAAFKAVSYPGIGWGDFDGDGDLDLAMCGYATTGMVTHIYRYNGGAAPFVRTANQLEGVWLGDCGWADYDNDGLLDLLVVGGGSNNARVAKLYQNLGGGILTNVPSGIDGMRVMAFDWGDYDNDGDLDLAMAGQTTNGYRSFIYRNQAPVPNTPPTAPTGLSVVITNGNEVILSWNAATDAQTPSASLAYNLYVGPATNHSGIMSPEADISSGWRRVVALGNTQMRRTWHLKNLPGGGELTWGVQAIDGAYAGGAFASGSNITPEEMPDFVIAGITIGTVPFCASVTVSNQGAAAGNAGSLSVWLNHPSLAVCGEASDRTNTTIGILGAGETATIEFSGFEQPAAWLTNTFRAFINSTCSELEARHDNNQATCTYAVYEHDNFWFNAVALTNSVYIRWINPTNSGLQTANVLIRYSDTAYPTNITQGTLLYEGTNQLVVHDSLTQGQPYYYTIWVSNDGTNWVDPPER